MDKKPKHKPKSFKKMGEIERVDEKTFYVKRSTSEGDPYMVFNSANEGWLCDCMNYTLNIGNDGKGKDCKHIITVKNKFSLS